MSSLKNRVELAAHFNALGFKVGAEVGVFAGYYSEVLCRAIPGLKLYCVDSWVPYHKYRDHKFESSFKKAYDSTVERLAPYDHTIIKKFSMEAVKDFEDESLDFVYIDGNHSYEHVRDDVREWAKKVRKGGIVAGDDYYVMRSGNVGVIKAVDEYAAEHGVDLHIIPEDKNTPTITHDDRQPQWWMVK
jgi:predicted O-methyltransferase YrrM